MEKNVSRIDYPVCKAQTSWSKIVRLIRAPYLGKLCAAPCTAELAELRRRLSNLWVHSDQWVNHPDLFELWILLDPGRRSRNFHDGVYETHRTRNLEFMKSPGFSQETWNSVVVN